MDLYSQIQALLAQVVDLQNAQLAASSAAADVIAAKKAEQATADTNALMYKNISVDLQNALDLLPVPTPEPVPEPAPAVS